MAATKPVLNLLRMSRFPIYNQLILEEALLRATKANWCIINDGAFCPAIVMGISGKPKELVHVPAVLSSGVQLIKRFSGGGTVVVDQDTIFTTLIMQGESVPGVPPYPQPIMQWSEAFYQSVFGAVGDFKLRENDYVFQQRKFGGNAQSITGRRWLHHTSLLWDFDPQRMALLKQPARAPEYRQGRTHLDFICRLREVVGSRQQLVEQLAAAGEGAGFRVQEVSLGQASAALGQSKVCGTRLIDLAQHVAQSA
mmetsp:Transcript_4807/g.10347  ORF Transcript_4807/g.10347 Transcript_4807/m.10347 type:complete len:253 (+) Transcript_4807:124-882(+)|eukprot:CAMPEP_0202920706 /NCGR_PEP_ID=MMETSP1392-20130828/77001_1 /ASSEMBLY_ACC=CAM_ASM_000868 /TAXON_ID=225041 /ORGANISM="Chlamydomonas chlamydogama, Strain SAG 11-48b" /LENGTH=252 /DNA_ID=CAMNT_0049614217 /DNA_START=113 /DNA_END=871 /DNA_ORIENTATION=-